MTVIKHQANSRGQADFGWLHSRHTFSFGRYYDPSRINFGALRVLNDDIVQGGMGFGAHPHDNMEIVSIPLQGDLEHKDSTGNTEVIRTGDVQIMSAGTGITHSEYNHSKTEAVNFLQIWVLPKQRDITPRYQQITFDPSGRKNQFQTVVAPDDQQALWINQDAWFSLADLTASKGLTYHTHQQGNGIYTFVIDGEVKVNEAKLEARDALGVTSLDAITITATSDSQLLVIEVPMIASPF